MTKTELIQTLATQSGVDKKQTRVVLDTLAVVVEKTVRKGGDVPLAGLGKFRVVKRKARTGRNPATGHAVRIPAKNVVKFSVSKSLKDVVKKKHK